MVIEKIKSFIEDHLGLLLILICLVGAPVFLWKINVAASQLERGWWDIGCVSQAESLVAAALILVGLVLLVLLFLGSMEYERIKFWFEFAIRSGSSKAKDRVGDRLKSLALDYYYADAAQRSAQHGDVAVPQKAKIDAVLKKAKGKYLRALRLGSLCLGYGLFKDDYREHLPEGIKARAYGKS